MEKQVITREQAVKDLTELFGISESTKSRVNKERSSFHIDKGEFERDEVLEKLSSYFKDKVLEDNYVCEIFPITIISTVFEIKAIK